MEEIWKSVIGYEGFYEVSNQGRVRSVDRFVMQVINGVQTKCLYKGRILKFTNDNSGYPMVTLSALGKIKTFRIHRLVADVFIENPESKKTVNHINAIKTDNRIENLEWATQLENNVHANYNGLINRKKRKGLPQKYPVSQYDIYGNFIQNWESASFAAKTLGFDQTSISKCVLGKYKTSYGFVWIKSK
jgi:hypothetical protein